MKEEQVYKYSTKTVLKTVSVQLRSHDLKKELSGVVRKSSSDGKWMTSQDESGSTELSFERTRTKHVKEHILVEII